jgi:methyl-accepting chemotaxis protein
VPAILHTTRLVQQVNTSTAEQAVNVSGVNLAVQQVSQVTQRNASATEELSATASQLATQATTLRQLLGRFLLPPAPKAGPPAPQPGAGPLRETHLPSPRLSPSSHAGRV